MSIFIMNVREKNEAFRLALGAQIGAALYLYVLPKPVCFGTPYGAVFMHVPLGPGDALPLMMTTCRALVEHSFNLRDVFLTGPSVLDSLLGELIRPGKHLLESLDNLRKAHLLVLLTVVFFCDSHELARAVSAIVGVSEGGGIRVNGDKLKTYAVTLLVPFVRRDFVPIMGAIGAWFFQNLFNFTGIFGISRFVTLAEQLAKNAHSPPFVNAFNLHCNERCLARQEGVS